MKRKLLWQSMLQNKFWNNPLEITNVSQLKESLISILNDEKTDSQNKLDYAYNPDYDSRKLIVKDNYTDSNERFYGNNDVEGPDATVYPRSWNSWRSSRKWNLVAW